MADTPDILDKVFEGILALTMAVVGWYVRENGKKIDCVEERSDKARGELKTELEEKVTGVTSKVTELKADVNSRITDMSSGVLVLSNNQADLSVKIAEHMFTKADAKENATEMKGLVERNRQEVTEKLSNLDNKIERLLNK